MSGHSEKYTWKEIPGSSHDLLRRHIRSLSRGIRLLDLGAAGGHLGRAVRDHCAFLAGVEPDAALPESSRAGYDDWRAVDALAAGEWPEPFDAVVCADVLEHLVAPEELLARIRGWLKPGGTLLVSLPNIANVSIRLALLFGHFRYTDRGILDRSHVSFYTRSSARHLLEGAGFHIRSMEPTAMPYELAAPSLLRGGLRTAARGFAQGTARVWPTLFGYQFVFEAARR
ncbi:MAG: class I SAM-dependent methyltransferase [Thermoanaerobaculia bacterium]